MDIILAIDDFLYVSYFKCIVALTVLCLREILNVLQWGIIW